VDNGYETKEQFAASFIRALDDGVKIAAGEKRGKPARELVDELKKYVEEERARERQ